MIEYRPIDAEYRSSVIEVCTEYWGSPAVVSKDTLHSVENLPGYIAIEKGKLVGFVMYNIVEQDCEMVTLASLKEDKGIGTTLINRVILTAQQHSCRRVWLVTTNDNIHALRFYQRRGFDMVGLRRNAIDKARKHLKPQIPELGFDDIPIRHEIELEFIPPAAV